MSFDNLQYKCKICGTISEVGIIKCPKCGQDLDLFGELIMPENFIPVMPALDFTVDNASTQNDEPREEPVQEKALSQNTQAQNTEIRKIERPNAELFRKMDELESEITGTGIYKGAKAQIKKTPPVKRKEEDIPRLFKNIDDVEQDTDRRKQDGINKDVLWARINS